MSQVTDEPGVVRVSRTIAATADRVFAVLADPAWHPSIDGSGMLRSAPANRPITGVGEVFVMGMSYDTLGSYETDNHVVAFEPGRRIVWEPAPREVAPAAAAGVPVGVRVGHRWGYELEPAGDDQTVVTEVYDCSRASDLVRVTVHDGKAWRRSMARTLERLDALLTGCPLL